MGNRGFSFAPNEHYHCYNRGVEKRCIFEDQQDYVYFLKLLRHLNTSEVLGKLRLQENREPTDPPVTILAYCLLPNHYHLLLRNNHDDGISKYIKRVSVGYTMYFNQKYQRSGGLFQGTFKAEEVMSDQDLRQVLAYVRFNNQVHDILDESLYRSSLNTNDDLVRGLTSNFGDVSQREVVDIIKKQRQKSKLV